MTDESKPRVVDRTQQAERDWVEQEARRREDRWEYRKRGLDADRRGRRTSMTALELHRHAIERLAKISTVPASALERSSANAEERIGPAAQQTLDEDPVWDEHWHVIRSRLERVHEKLDEAEGLGPTATTTRMLGVEKDKRVITEGEGLSPLAVVEMLGRDIAGSPETVRRIRKKAGRSVKDGRQLAYPAPGQFGGSV